MSMVQSTIWQASAGPTLGSYADVCLGHVLPMPRAPGNSRLIIGGTRLGFRVDRAPAQAQEHARNLGTTCDIIVTDGIRYRMYEGARGYAPLAYGNLARLKQPAADFFARLRRS